MLTRSEHIARAMLLGLRYLPNIGLYFQGNRAGGRQLDANTLAVVEWQAAIGRLLQANVTSESVWYEEAPEDT